MNWLSRTAARLMPAERRDWAEAMWAEADEVAPGLARLAWRAGGLRLIAREALLMRREVGPIAGIRGGGGCRVMLGRHWRGIQRGNPATAEWPGLDVVTVHPAGGLAGRCHWLAAWWLFTGPTDRRPDGAVLRASRCTVIVWS